MVSAPAGLSGKLTLVEWIELADGAEGGTRAGSCVAAPTKATGCATTGDGADAAVTGALLTGALWRPTE